MKKFFLSVCAISVALVSFAQADVPVANRQPIAKTKGPGRGGFTVLNNVEATPVKNQAQTNTCWSFSTTSLVESQCLKNNLGEFDLSEMFTVRNIYIEKAKNYVLRQGSAQFGEGGLGHDQIRAIAVYGAVPESVYSGLKPGQQLHNHKKLFADLKHYVDSVIHQRPVPDDWLKGFTKILDSTLGVPPAKFDYKGKTYTPQSFAREALKFNAADYVNITSFTHHPYYEPFILEVPDNFSNGAYYNLPLDEMIQLVKGALSSGYTVLWDADVSNSGFMQERGMAINLNPENKLQSKNDIFNGKAEDSKWDAARRQKLFENLTTQDDHLMHITGIERSETGSTFFITKNSWGDVGPMNDGYINVSEAYFAINTISLIIPKAAFSKEMLEKLKIK
jgi:bleomycin hydrolase